MQKEIAMQYNVEQRRMITPATGSVFSLYAIVNSTGHALAMTDATSVNVVTITFEDRETADAVVSALNDSLAPLEKKIIGKRKSSGKYEIKTEKGIFDVELEKTGAEATWKVVLPSGDLHPSPFSTKREAMNAVAEMAEETA